MSKPGAGVEQAGTRLEGLALSPDQTAALSAEELLRLSAASAAAEAALAAAAAAEADAGDDSSLDLQRYQALQHRIALLQGLSIHAQVFQLQRRASALRLQLASMEQLADQAKLGVAKAQKQYDKFSGASKKFYPGKLPDKLLGKTETNIAKARVGLEAAEGKVAQRDEQWEGLQQDLQEATVWLAVWEAMDAELQASQREVAAMDARLLLTAPTQASESDSFRKIELLDALCAMEEEAEEEEKGSEEEEAERAEAEAQAYGLCAGPISLLKAMASKLPGVKGTELPKHSDPIHLLRVSMDQLGRAVHGETLEVEVAGAEEGQAPDTAAPAAGEAGKEGKHVLFDGTLARKLADKIGRVDEAQGGDRFGRYGRGRLLRIAADRMQSAADLRRQKKQQGLARVEEAMGRRHNGKQKLVPDDSLAHLFPKDACNFNPGIHCPPSTFLWLYPSRFMGKLQKLQTGPVLQAFYRFGPFDCDPDNPKRLIPRTPDGPPLFMLTGLGSTMIAWGLPLLRALATTHEVVIMEYRGAGLSKNLGDEPWNYYNQAEAVLLLADALGVPRFNWMGWSSGGNTGLVLAALYGERLGRMASLAGMAGGPNTIVPPAYAALNPDMSLSLGQTMALIFPPDDPKEFRATCGQYIKEVFSMPGSIVDQEVGPEAAKEQWVADQEFIHNDGRVWDALPLVTNPCLIMNGDRDVLVPHENAVRISQRIPGAQLHTWEGWGHGFKDAARLARVVNEFMCAPAE